MMKENVIGASLLLLLLSPTPGEGQAPATVTNLEVTHAHSRLTIRFRAPSTAVARFAIKYSETSANLMGVNFSNDALNEELEQSDLTTGELTPPTPGSNVTLQVDPFKVFEGESQYFFAMKSENEQSGWSDVSNIANVTVDHAGDNTPPLGVSDLNVTFVNGELTATFTCPGDDGMGEDPVAKISIRYAVDSKNLNAENFHNDNLNDEISMEDLMPSYDLTPPSAGNSVVTLKLNPEQIFETAPQYSFAIKTVDDSLNWSKLSNIVNVTTGSAPSPDGPTAVTDLTATYQSGQLYLTFTAPAASNSSAVSRFVIRYANQRGFVDANNFDNHADNDEIEVSDLLEGSSLTPPAPNAAVTLGLNPYEIFDDDVDQAEYFFSMKSVAGSNSWSNLSNIVSVSYTASSGSRISFSTVTQVMLLTGCFKVLIHN